ncbi:MAG: hypothetical protein O2887_13770 [Bacteroidetes bacterium]|nr:hypothetical protein [Bacteroidota bacterium]MDA1121538.1 hypothetical protein [Bacteroidota bacterium]
MIFNYIDFQCRNLVEIRYDFVTIKEQLGHAHIQTTMIYLHVAKVNRTMAHSPFDRLYPDSPEA